ncbi:tRNA lysidine(34) synthetase TilS [Spiroplasma alleghenense]|uniref:tRNA(Ile)-lysidine synthase n=1 Tax=Spiroplasma alleghenense TaxID=216931 RepID=A0A345Z259_9MOLU|nr:tRNA lysidine(34) synthetase TilS [Spiroplasma alleghenense]AXK50688.1 tRNA(Ile)-lysidine synthase [Spiroplasma alleghenense]
MQKIDWEKKYLVAVSGGPDSIFLLSSLISDKNFKHDNFIVCHVNYNYREDSRIDQKIVEEICESNKIKLEIRILNEDYSNLGDNFENFARVKRYDFFLEISKKYKNFNTVLIAHNFNDLIETFLIQKQRKNIVDFWGLKETTFYKELIVFRPILDLKKSEIMKFLEVNKIDYAIDSTNFDEKFLRNKIRKEINEKDFGQILKQIISENEELTKNNDIAQNYLKNHSSDFHIYIKDIGKLSEKTQQIVIAKFLLKSEIGRNLAKSKKAIFKEIVKICQSKKPYVIMKKNDVVVLKDFEKVIISDLKTLSPATYSVKNNKAILEKWGPEASERIKNLDLNPDCYITNDYWQIKSKLYYKGKKLTKYYSEKKVGYFERMKNLYILDKYKTIILYIV